jgi:hypothetical protein
MRGASLHTLADNGQAVDGPDVCGVAVCMRTAPIGAEDLHGMPAAQDGDSERAGAGGAIYELVATSSDTGSDLPPADRFDSGGVVSLTTPRT